MKSPITYTTAIDYILNHYELPEGIAERMTALRESISKRNASHGSPEAQERMNAKRKEKNATERANYLATVIPVLRVGVTNEPSTVKQIFERVKDAMPQDFTVAKLQYMLSRGELGEDVIKDDNGKNPNTYHI